MITQTIEDIKADKFDAMYNPLRFDIVHGSVRDYETQHKLYLMKMRDTINYLDYLGAQDYLNIFTNQIVTAGIIGGIIANAIEFSNNSHRRIAIEIMGHVILPSYNEMKKRIVRH